MSDSSKPEYCSISDLPGCRPPAGQPPEDCDSDSPAHPTNNPPFREPPSQPSSPSPTHPMNSIHFNNPPPPPPPAVPQQVKSILSRLKSPQELISGALKRNKRLAGRFPKLCKAIVETAEFYPEMKEYMETDLSDRGLGDQVEIMHYMKTVPGQRQGDIVWPLTEKNRHEAKNPVTEELSFWNNSILHLKDRLIGIKKFKSPRQKARAKKIHKLKRVLNLKLSSHRISAGKVNERDWSRDNKKNVCLLAFYFNVDLCPFLKPVDAIPKSKRPKPTEIPEGLRSHYPRPPQYLEYEYEYPRLQEHAWEQDPYVNTPRDHRATSTAPLRAVLVKRDAPSVRERLAFQTISKLMPLLDENIQKKRKVDRQNYMGHLEHQDSRDREYPDGRDYEYQDDLDHEFQDGGQEYQDYLDRGYESESPVHPGASISPVHSVSPLYIAPIHGRISPCVTQQPQRQRVRNSHLRVRHQPQLHQAQLHQAQLHQAQLHQAQLHQPQLHQPQLHWPQLHQPQLRRPQYHQPKLHQPQLHEPQHHQPQHHQPQHHQPQHHQPQHRQPQHRQPQHHQPQHHQPQHHQRQHHKTPRQQRQHNHHNHQRQHLSQEQHQYQCCWVPPSSYSSGEIYEQEEIHKDNRDLASITAVI